MGNKRESDGDGWDVEVFFVSGRIVSKVFFDGVVDVVEERCCSQEKDGLSSNGQV
jgi:hypothetical protein